jgi:hypothetical protein
MRRASPLKQKMKKKTHPIFFKFFFLTPLNTKSLHPHSQGSKSKFFFICTQHLIYRILKIFIDILNLCIFQKKILICKK